MSRKSFGRPVGGAAAPAEVGTAASPVDAVKHDRGVEAPASSGACSQSSRGTGLQDEDRGDQSARKPGSQPSPSPGSALQSSPGGSAASRRSSNARRRFGSLATDAHGNILDVFGTSDRHGGPWPNPRDDRLVSWIKLEREEYMCKRHESDMARIEDCSFRDPLMVMLPYAVGATTIKVDDVGIYETDVMGATEKAPVFLFNVTKQHYLLVTGAISRQELTVKPAEKEGGMYDSVGYVSSSVNQQVSENKPIYRRNILNYMPSIRFTPDQFLHFDEECLLQSRLSGPTDQTSFTWFFVAKGYASQGSSPWPLFTALDTKTGWSFQLQVVIEQRSNQPFEPRWKFSCGKWSEKTDQVDPKAFHIITILKAGRVVRLFIDGCWSGAPAAEFILEDEDVISKINYVIFGLDANGSKYFDGELAEFLAYDRTLLDAEIDGIGRYLSRKFALSWDWVKPRRSIKLDDWLATKEASAAVRRQTASSHRSDEQNHLVQPARDAKKQVSEYLEGLKYPESAQNSMDALASVAGENARERAFVLQKIDWDILFSYIESQQTPTRTSAMLLIAVLTQDNEDAKREVAQREGVFQMLRACQPTWKFALEAAMKAKSDNLRRAMEERDALAEELDNVPPSELNRAFQLRMQLNQANLKWNQCALEVDAVARRMKSGIEEKNSWDLQRESLRALASMCANNEGNQEVMVELDGIAVLHEVIEMPSVPVKSSVCKVARALVATHPMAERLLEDSLLHKIVRLIFIDDPPLQCEACAVVQAVLTHRSLRVPMLEADLKELREKEENMESTHAKIGGGDGLLQAIEFMLKSDSEDNHIAAANILFIFAAHDVAVRSVLARSDVVVERAVALSRSSELKLRQSMIKLTAYLCLDQTAVDKAWKCDLQGVLLELLQDPDLHTLTHALMALGNATRTDEDSIRVRELSEQTALVDYICDIAWTRPEHGLQHLVCGVLTNLATPQKSHASLLNKTEIMLDFLVEIFLAASCLRKLSSNPSNAERIVKARALPPLIQMAREPKMIVDEPHHASVDRRGRTMYLHWQAGRAIAAFTKSEEVHLEIFQEGGIFALVQLCQSQVSLLCREGASSLAYIAEVKCEPEVLLQMAEEGAIDVLQGLAEDDDDSTGSEAIRALSSLLNFDNAWAD